MSFALVFGACLAEFADERDAARAAAEELIAIAEQYEYAYWSAWSRIVAGWSHAVTHAAAGGLEDGEALLRRGLSEYEATGAGLLTSYAKLLLTPLAERRGAPCTRLRADALDAARRGSFWEAWCARKPNAPGRDAA